MNATLSGLDELRLFPSAEAREKALGEYASSIRGWDLILGSAIVATTGFGSMYLATLLVGAAARLWPWVLQPVVREPLKFAIVIVSVLLTLRLLHRWGARRDLRGKLIDLGVPVCMACGYLLRGLPEHSTTCPECGQAIPENVRDMLASAPAA